VINSFGNSGTEDLYHGNNSKEARRLLPNHLHKIAKRKMDMIDACNHLTDLRIPPSNHLESLKVKFMGYYSIRINDQWRIIFRWSDLGADAVQIIDYH
jgi:proteic killer suppression protein